MKNKKSKNLEVLKNMPPMYHTLPGEEFDLHKSEVIEWALNQPDLLNWFYSRLVSSRNIEYNREMKYWVGVDYQGGQEDE
ncbi:hypothetical protein FEZ48_13315 [Marinilactibacillus psychrotolerans]|uniref:Uncharacterized protein n=1 Tax=Marinilactibacillus psychrotolerans TaxID=191770 RepID=A0A5R9BVN1_9LACT|nr:hypothetical protein [Marinilactibacillus psychrotolerans]TLQ04734.1 hypothetical protein FEZ48_13315 [Marinilactibacillus psychrotolerans]